MKTHQIIKIFLLISSAIIVNSCGDDTTTNTPVIPSGTVLYSQDSMSVWIQTSSGEGHDSVSYSISTPTAVKVEFTLQSNADSSHAMGYYFFNTNSSPAEPYIPNVLEPIDQLISQTYSSNPLSTYFNFSARLKVSGGSMPYYIKLKNIKVMKL